MMENAMRIESIKEYSCDGCDKIMLKNKYNLREIKGDDMKIICDICSKEDITGKN
jgi:hypothetical protein